ncbi:MAG: hypothetical protein V7724_14250 [Sediminicola sp.]
MARIGSPFIITGTLWIDRSIRGRWGFNGKDIKTRPEMGSKRENGRELGHCAEVKSVFMGASRPYFVGIRGRRIHY